MALSSPHQSTAYGYRDPIFTFANRRPLLAHPARPTLLKRAHYRGVPTRHRWLVRLAKRWLRAVLASICLGGMAVLSFLSLWLCLGTP
jgi:hypothetical protein